ncbi:MAG: acyloxyacyl hydrolase [Candidatus Omnitrophica bacterium]|nr:acyloxyacyl hydrolase [Candidatus Omnitrophota bacterium]
MTRNHTKRFHGASAAAIILGFLFLTESAAFAGGLDWLRHPDRCEVRAGYGWQYTNNSRPNNFQIISLLPSVAYPLTDDIGPAWIRGRFEWNPELNLALFTHPYVRPLFGATLLQFHYGLEPKGRWSPYLLAGAGVLRADINRRETRSRVNFNLQAGIGVGYAISERTSLLFEYRHTHISNAGLDEDNSGLNTHTFLAGVSIRN